MLPPRAHRQYTVHSFNSSFSASNYMSFVQYRVLRHLNFSCKQSIRSAKLHNQTILMIKQSTAAPTNSTINNTSEYDQAKTMRHTSSLPKPSPWSVRAVLDQLPNAPKENTSTPISFFHYVERLKLEKREGWRRFGINHGESIADHMYRMSILTMLAPPSLSSKLDIPRCTRMALIHDMAEGLVGDLTPVDGVPKVEKNRREADTMNWIATSLLGKVHGGIAGQDILSVWQEYEDSETLESKFVHDVDKVELILQMVEYERANDCKLDLSEFSRVAMRVSLPEMQAWAQEIMDEREKLWEEHNKKPREEGETVEAAVLKKQQDEYYGGGTVNGVVNGHEESSENK